MEEESKSNNNNNNKHSSFSLFGLSKGRKVCQVSNKEELDKEKQQKRKLGFDVIHALKRLFRGRREREKVGLHESAYSSHSGNLMRKKKPELRGIRRGECSSAPASMRASPTNSGLLLATATTLPTSAANDSTMEELQAAIQAAIAHCKNSIAKEDNNLIKCTS
nr:BRI1 kinase inhibitor 1 [Arachis hypogaea]